MIGEDARLMVESGAMAQHKRVHPGMCRKVAQHDTEPEHRQNHLFDARPGAARARWAGVFRPGEDRSAITGRWQTTTPDRRVYEQREHQGPSQHGWLDGPYRPRPTTDDRARLAVRTFTPTRVMWCRLDGSAMLRNAG